MNGKRIIAAVVNREKHDPRTDVTRNMQYSNGSWNDSHR